MTAPYQPQVKGPPSQGPKHHQQQFYKGSQHTIALLLPIKKLAILLSSREPFQDQQKRGPTPNRARLILHHYNKDAQPPSQEAKDQTPQPIGKATLFLEWEPAKLAS